MAPTRFVGKADTPDARWTNRSVPSRTARCEVSGASAPTASVPVPVFTTLPAGASATETTPVADASSAVPANTSNAMGWAPSKEPPASATRGVPYPSEPFSTLGAQIPSPVFSTRPAPDVARDRTAPRVPHLRWR